MRRRRTLLLCTVLSLATAACGTTGVNSNAPAVSATPTRPYNAADSGPSTPAAALRVRWSLLLEEHQLLAFKTTGATIAGHLDTATAYAGQLSRNGSELGDLIAASYGGAARDRFNAIWVAHDLAIAEAAQSDGLRRAHAEQTGHFVPELTALLAGLTGIPATTVSRAAAQEAGDSDTVVAAQTARDYPRAYSTLHAARIRLGEFAEEIVAAMAAQRPTTLTGNPRSRAAQLAVDLNTLLQEHAYEFTAASDALLGGRSDDVNAATRALEANAGELAQVLNGVFGSEARRHFGAIWAAHDNYLLDYARAAAITDAAGEQHAIQNLDQIFTPRFVDYLTGLLDTPADGIRPALAAQLATLTAVLDAQGAQRADDAAQRDRLAAATIAAVAARLAVAITDRAPDSFA
ncbi:MAG: hypothetical protein ABR541_01045 [Candidatus Dormibacteria bacterium]